LKLNLRVSKCPQGRGARGKKEQRKKKKKLM